MKPMMMLSSPFERPLSRGIAVVVKCAAAEKRRVTRNTPNAHFRDNYCLVFFSYYF
jgi:hypothetical protein